MPEKKQQHTKSIVIIGFFTLIILCVSGIFMIYKELLKFSETSDTAEERKELITTGSLMAMLYKVESMGNLLITELSSPTTTQYDSLMVATKNQIDSLKIISADPIMTINLDSISSLLDMKSQNVKRMVQLLDSIKILPPKEVVTSTIFSKKDLDKLNNIIKQNVKSSEDTTVLKVKKKNFMQRVQNVFSAKNDTSLVISKSNEIVRDSVVVPLIADTISSYVKEMVWQHEARHRDLTQRLIRRQSSMHRMNEELSAQISSVLRKVEFREYETSLKFLREKEITLRRSSKIVSGIGMLASCTTLIFLILTLRSITNSQRYRREIEAAKKYAEDLLDARERLIFAITHDIKAPISSIIGYLELLSNDKLSEKERYYIENMQHSSEHILDLVKNLLDYHSLESDKQDFKTMSFFPTILLRDIHQSFVPVAKKSGLNFQFNCDIPNEMQSYESDPYRIRQICSNLLSNALKFTNFGGNVMFNVSLISIDDKNDMLCLSIKDTGPGISKDNQELIFDEFQRLDLHKGTIEGSGLGLTITRKLVKLLKGKISLNSEIGAGSEFIVKIPLRKSEIQQIDEAEFMSTDIDLGKIYSGKKILFIDDDLIQLNLYSELMKKKGFQTITCRYSLDALALIQTVQFDIIFTDIQMPDMNGFELVERIRMGTFENAKTIPVIALSASSNISEQKFKEAGFSGFLSKPFTSISILNVVKSFLDIQIGDSSFTQEKETETGFNSLMIFASEDPEAGKAIVHSFIEENKKNIEQIQIALHKKDWEMIRKIAHKMLPLMRMISAKKLVQVLVQVENGEKDEKKVEFLVELTEYQLNEAEEFLKTI